MDMWWGTRWRVGAGLVALVALTACQGRIGETLREPAPPPVALPYEPQAPVLPRLTQKQYRASLLDLLGAPLPPTPAQADTNPFLFFSIGATTTTLSEIGAQQFEEAATQVTRTVFDDTARRAALVGCTPSSSGDGCVQTFIERFGRRVYRRPLDAAERARWLSVATGLAEGDAWRGLAAVVAGMLQSPYFVYRVELGEPDPTAPERLRLTSFELASRLAFVLWNTIPDDALLDAAAHAELDTTEEIAARARLMLADARARASVQDFFEQYLDLGKLEGLTRSPAFPTFTPTLREAMRTEVKLLVDDLVYRRDTDVRTLYSTRRTFVNSELAAHYGVMAYGSSAVSFVPVELPATGPRAGLLTLGAFLTMNAHESTTSPTLRGKYLRERVMCAKVPAPPPDVDTGTVDEGPAATTLRERLAEHRENPACASCHVFIDPPGLLFEGFDAIGAHRTRESGQPIDTSGDLDGVPLAGPVELGALLAESPAVSQCMVEQLYRHAQGRLNSWREVRALDEVHARFAASGYRFKELLVALVSHESFRLLAPPEPEEAP